MQKTSILISRKSLFIKLICFLYFSFTSYFLLAQKQTTIIVKVETRNKSNFLLEDNLLPAINFPDLTKKNINELQSNSEALLLLDELKKYYYLQVSDIDKYSKLKELREKGLQVYFDVQYKIEQDKLKINDPLYKEQWALQAVQAIGAWRKATGKGSVVGVIDTGIDYDHQDLVEQLWINPAEDLNGNGRFDNWPSTEERDGVFGDLDGIDNDGNGFVDDVIGYDFVDKKVVSVGDVTLPDCNPVDEHGHGTAVSSVIAAKNNDLGIIGLAFDAKIMTLRACDAQGVGESKDIANAIVYAAINGAHVINLSLGEYQGSELMHTAIKFANSLGCVIVASAGNKGIAMPHYPSDYSEVISVGGCNESLRYQFNYGDRLDITAPGINIYSALPNNRYKKSHGTSFAAPLVSAVAALLKEKDKTLNGKEIRDIIQFSAKKVANGWTREYGAGILNADRALNEIEKSNIEIIYPKNEQVINLSRTDTVFVKGNVLTPLFQSYVLRIRENSPSFYDNIAWDTLVEPQYTTKNNEIIGKFYTGNFNDSLKTYTLDLIVTLKNGNTLETRSYIKFCSDKNGIEIKKFACYQPFYYEKRLAVANIQTNVPCNAIIFYRPKNSDMDYKKVVSNNHITKNHIVPMDIKFTGEIEAYALAILTDADTARKDFEFTLTDETFPVYSFKKKEYELPRAYIYDKPIKLEVKGNEYISINKLTDNLEIGAAQIYDYSKKDGFVMIDSAQKVYITKGNGDSNYDGIYEILAGAYTEYSIFQKKDKQSSIYANPIFQLGYEKGLKGEQIIDVNGDKKEDVIFVDESSSFYVYSYEDNEYKLKVKQDINKFMEEILQEKFERKFSIQQNFAIDDFDGDGFNEIALTTRYNDYLLIIGIDENFNVKLKDWIKLENFHSVPYVHYITSCDLDADGKKEIVYLYFGKFDMGENELGENEIWTYSVFQFDENNKIKKIFEDDIYGVRISNLEVGFFFRNGITAGNLDNEKGDEVIIATFPNLYILKWDIENKKLVPMWSYPASLTNNAIVFDVDKNGKNDVGFTAFSNTLFFEFDEKYKNGTEIIEFDGWATSNNSAYFQWKTTDVSSKEFELWIIETKKLIDPKAKFDIYKTQDNHIEITNLGVNKHYTAYVKCSQTEDYFSQAIEVFTAEKTKAIYAKYNENNNLIEIKFTGLLPFLLEAGNFSISNEAIKDKIIPITSVTVLGDSTVKLDFKEQLPEGEYQVKVHSFRDFWGNHTLDTILEFSLKNHFITELFLKKLDYIQPNKLIIEFSEPVQSDLATAIENYKFLPFGDIKNIMQIAPDKIEVLLEESMLFGRGKNYLITASQNIIATSGNVMTSGAGNTLGFALAEKNLENVYVYPSPISLSKVEGAFIGHLTRNAKVEIMSLDGKVLATLEEFDGNGGIYWDLRDTNGNLLDVGVYIIKAIDGTNSGGEKITKFAIIK